MSRMPDPSAIQQSGAGVDNRKRLESLKKLQNDRGRERPESSMAANTLIHFELLIVEAAEARRRSIRAEWADAFDSLAGITSGAVGWANDERMHHYMRRRTSITGLKVKFRGAGIRAY